MGNTFKLDEEFNCRLSHCALIIKLYNDARELLVVAKHILALVSIKDFYFTQKLDCVISVIFMNKLDVMGISAYWLLT